MNSQDQDWAKEPPAADLATGPLRRARGAGSIVTTLIWINAGIFLISAFVPDLGQRIYAFGVLVPAKVILGGPWRLITAQYLHASTLHLAVNMIALHFLGRPLEDRWSARKFFAIYTICGLCGNVFFVFLGYREVLSPWTTAVGASGCIYGLLGIVAVLYPHAKVLLFFIIPMRIRTAAIVLGAVAFISVIERGRNYGGEACHLAGLLFGVWWALHGEQWWSTTEWAWKPKRR